MEKKYSGAELFTLLEIIDPSMAKFLHSNDQRRVLNALLKFFKNKNLKESDV